MRSISKESFPFIVDLNTNKKYQWNKGRIAELLSSTKAVSISVGGVYFLHRSQHVFTDIGDGKCYRAEDCLCVNPSSMRVFPIFDSKVVFGQKGSICQSSASGRTLVFSGFSDITLCDIENDGHNVILKNNGDYVHGKTRMSSSVSAVLTVLQVVVVAFIVHKLSWFGEETTQCERWRFRTSCLVIAIGIFSVLLALCTSGPHGVYVSVEDIASLIYISLYVFFHAFCWFFFIYSGCEKEPSLGFLLGSLVLLFFRSFSTLNNPSVFICLIFVFYKLFINMNSVHSSFCHLNCVLDSFLLGILVSFGVYPQYECEYELWGHLLLLLCGVVAFHRIYIERKRTASEL